MTQPYDEGTVPPWGSPSPAAEPPRPQRPGPGAPGQQQELTCPLCGGFRFDEEEGRLNTKWGMGGHILTMQVCRGCGYVMFFYQGSGMAG